MTEDPRKSAARRRFPSGAVARTRYVVGLDLGTTNSVVAVIEGGLLLARTKQSAVPLRDAGVEAADLVAAATASLAPEHAA